MKKFCSECGHPLDLDKRFCSECGTANPFYSTHFEFTTVRTNTLEALRQKRLLIEKQLYEEEAKQRELEEQQRRLKEQEQQSQLRTSAQEESVQQAKVELQAIENLVKNELRQMKTDAEARQQQTTELLRELRQTVVQIDEERKRLQEQLDDIAKAKAAQTPAPEPEEEAAQEVSASLPIEQSLPERGNQPAPVKRNYRGLGGALAITLLIGIVYFYYAANRRPEERELPPTETATKLPPKILSAEQPIAEQPKPEPAPKDMKMQEGVLAGRDDATEKAPPQRERRTGKKENRAAVSALSSEESPRSSEIKSVFRLTAEQAKKDLVGQRLSGCGIVLNNVKEVNTISSPVAVDDAASAGYQKYKLSMKVTQGSETYRVTPYLYYSPSGQFLKVDAGNCE